MKKKLRFEVEIEKSSRIDWPMVATVTVNGKKPLIDVDNISLVAGYKGALMFAQDQLNQFIDVDVTERVWDVIFKEEE